MYFISKFSLRDKYFKVIYFSIIEKLHIILQTIKYIFVQFQRNEIFYLSKNLLFVTLNINFELISALLKIYYVSHFRNNCKFIDKNFYKMKYLKNNLYYNCKMIKNIKN